MSVCVCLFHLFAPWSSLFPGPLDTSHKNSKIKRVEHLKMRTEKKRHLKIYVYPVYTCKQQLFQSRNYRCGFKLIKRVTTFSSFLARFPAPDSCEAQLDSFLFSLSFSFSLHFTREGEQYTLHLALVLTFIAAAGIRCTVRTL